MAANKTMITRNIMKEKITSISSHGDLDIIITYHSMFTSVPDYSYLINELKVSQPEGKQPRELTDILPDIITSTTSDTVKDSYTILSNIF